MAIPLKSRLRSVGTLEVVVSHHSAMPIWSLGGFVLDNREVLPGGNLSPNHLGEGAEQTEVLSSFQGLVIKRT